MRFILRTLGWGFEFYLYGVKWNEEKRLILIQKTVVIEEEKEKKKPKHRHYGKLANQHPDRLMQ